MAYVLLVNGDNTITASKKERIVQRSKLVDTLWILTPSDYQGHDMSNATVLMEYLLPTSHKYGSMILRKDPDGYKDYLKYLLPDDDEINTVFTSESGELQLKLTFIYVDLDVDGKPIQMVRKTAPAYKMTVVPNEAWADIIPDEALSSLDQRIIKIDAQIKQLNEHHDILDKTKADNIKYDEKANSLQLMAGSKTIGDKVHLKDDTGGSGGIGIDGVPVVDLDDNDGGNPDVPKPEDPSCDDVVEF